MRILLVAYYYPPIISGGSQRPVRTAKYLAKLGNQVTVLAPAYARTLEPDPDVVRVYDASHNMKRRGIRGGQWLLMRLAVELLNRLGRYASIYSPWRRSVLRHADEIMRRIRPEIIVATYPPVETLEIGLSLSKKFNVPLVADFRDGLLFEPIESKRLGRFASVRKRYRKIEAEVARSAAAIITISPFLSAYFQNTYGLNAVATIPNGYDPDDLASAAAKTCLAAGVVHIVHTGKIALSDSALSLRPLIAALERLLNADPAMAQRMHLHWVGKLTAGEMQALAALKQWSIVTLYGERERRFSLAMQRDSDLLLLIPPSARPGIAPAKLFEYLAARKPILVLGTGTYAAAILQETKSGWAVPADDPQAIGNIMGRIVADPEFRASMVASAESIQVFSATQQSKEWDAILRQAMRPRPASR